MLWGYKDILSGYTDILWEYTDMLWRYTVGYFGISHAEPFYLFSFLIITFDLLGLLHLYISFE